MVKKCKQCGKASSDFRKSYTSDGYYNTCKVCEKINSRCKYLRRKDKLSTVEDKELEDIYKLYDIQRAMGLKPPTTTKKAADYVKSFVDESVTELTKWLTEPLTETPEYYDDIYEDLRGKYLKLYKAELDAVLERFCEYEDNYYKEDTNNG